METQRGLAGALRLVAASILFPLAVARGEGQLAPNRYDVEIFDTRAVEDAAMTGQTVDLSFFGRTHRIVLESSEVRSPRFAEKAGSLGDLRNVYSAPAKTFKGHIENEPSSIVRLTSTPNGLRGYVKSSEGWAFIEPLAPTGTQPLRIGASGFDHKVFTESDIPASFLGTCAEPLKIENAEPGQPVSTERPVRQSGATTSSAELRIFEMAVDADAEFYAVYGDQSTAEIESILNMVDGIYEAELGLSIEIVSANVWQAEPDPYTSTDSGTLLGEFRSYWNNNHSGINRDAAHLFTGKELDGSTVGIAYVSVVCSTSVAYGLSQDLQSDTLMPLLVAHEVGHNLGANHDASGSSPRYIMYPSLGFTNLDEFSTTSKSDVADYVDSVSCLELDGGGGSNISDPPGGGGGGGGGGPVDPIVLAVLGASWIAHRRAKRA